MYSRLLTSSFLLAQAATTASAIPTTPRPESACGKAIYVLGNDENNAVVALPISPNGMLSAGTYTPTGGEGGNIINANTNEPNAPDALVSQSALTVVGNHLFAVNAGSNTVTMFSIDEHDPTSLTMVGEPVPVPGEFPNTVTASQKHQVVCVGLTGAKAGIACAPFSEDGIGEMDGLRPIHLNQMTPPVGPANTVSQVFFSHDEMTLFTTVKGDGTMNNTGFLGAFPVTTKSCSQGAGGVSMRGTRSSPDGTMTLFGSFPIPGTSDLFLTDPGFGAVVVGIDSQTYAATLEGRGDIDGQMATCWSTYSPATNTAFVTDAAVNRLVEMSVTDATVMSTLDLSANGDPGLLDIAAAGKFLYALSPGNGTTSPAVTVVDAKAQKQIQHFEMWDLGVTKNAMGVAVMM